MTECEIFLALFDLPDPAARAAYLDRTCGKDHALRARLEALLRSHDAADSFLASPAVTPPDLNGDPTQEIRCASAGEDHENPDDEALAFLAETDRPDSLGRMGHYEVLEVLGRGGFGIVFRAFDEVLQREVAVKVLAPPLAATSPARKRFLREARSSARVRHPNVVRVYAVEEQPLPYLVMEYIPGETLQQRLDRTGPLDVTEVVQIGRQIAEGLAAAHAQGLIHRDVKPGNILIETGPQPHVKLTDFGLARAADDASLTRSGLVAGTPLFMSPEQASGEPLDHRADLFSLGSVLYSMTTGRPPFRAANTLAILKRVAEDTPRAIPEIIPEVPPWLCDLIARLHAKRPEDRFTSAREVADLLAHPPAEGQHHGHVRPLVRAKPSAIPPQAPRTRAWAAAAVLLLGLTGLGVLGVTEASGVTDVGGAVIRLFSPDGILVVEVDDPAVRVTVDGEDVVITGAGAKEIRLKPGRYKVLASKDGKTVSEELVTVTKNGRQVVRVSREPRPAAGEPPRPADAARWERYVAALPAEEQVRAVAARLKQLNPDFDGAVTPTIVDGVVTGLEFSTVYVTDIAPVRALAGLKTLACGGIEGGGKLADLSPLRGMRLETLACNDTRVADLSPLEGMSLKGLAFQHSRVSDLTPLAGMPLEWLNCSDTPVADLSPLKGMKLHALYFDSTRVADLSPLKGMPLRFLNFRDYRLQPDRDGALLRSLDHLETINSEPAAEYLKALEADPAADKP